MTINTDLTPKQVSATRWSSRIDAIRPFRRNLEIILIALDEIHTSNSFDKDSKFTAGILGDAIDFKFIVSVVVWHEILEKINYASTKLQFIRMDVDAAVVLLKETQQFLTDFREKGFEEAIQVAKEIAQKNSIPAEFCTSRGRKRRDENEEVVPPETIMKTDFFHYVLDVAHNSVEERFVALVSYQEQFSFLCEFDSFEESKNNGETKEVLTSTGKINTR